ncbi:PAS domain S-box/diguanylate cyclase (GGDEF) domain-containing protein [Terriglobus roseus DSM 18391]|uniref:PAS domain S-box/diguanylate cyclase (GGDEF) domain-containing protein n=1 Tax=Terriglobus roseus (strain DSM 18391 / NRRL B-41598 / KBS 63) TaxID=926566 RepID=I3ZJG2_TERRK|nr:GGDEF and EAL domain-containing protein [Terriglobus roseus]AFL89380.1 PAS domain S-box/diguanylate cyclase (GGDEF) domain-containing protein [Terriglobus roseus DSM 18391]
MREQPFSPHLPKVLIAALEERALGEGLSIEDFIVFAIAEKIARSEHQTWQTQKSELSRTVVAQEEQAEKNNQSMLADLFEQAPIFIAVLAGPEHVFEMVNQSCRDFLGGRELLGRRAAECFPESAKTAWLELLDDVYQRGDVRLEQDVQVSLTSSDGRTPEIKYVDIMYKPRLDSAGLVNGIITLGVDRSLLYEVLHSTSDGIFLLDRDWRFVYLNPCAIELLSGGKALVGRNVWEAFEAASSLEFWDKYHTTMEQRVPTEFEAYYPAPLDRWFQVHAHPISQGISVFFRDITERRGETVRLRLLEQTVDAAPIGIALSEYKSADDCPLIYVNPAFERLTGYSAEEVLGTDCRFLQGSDLGQPGGSTLQSAIANGCSGKAVLRNYKKDGTRFLNEVHISHVRGSDSKVSHIIGLQYDVTEQLETREQLAKQARHDALTGLSNRHALLEHLETTLAHAKASGRPVAVVVLDLDNFKHMNDRFGHIETDRILVHVSRRIASFAGVQTAARLGGDEFALILSQWNDHTDLGKLVEQLLHEISKPLPLGSKEILITGSAGIALFPQDTVEPEELLQMADVSMYAVKRRGKNSFRFYTADLRFNQNEPLDVAVGFRRALANSEFELYYQPRVNASSKRIIGCEALIRWNHPDRGTLLPAQFIRIAEDTGLINEIGRWVLEEALQQNASWRRSGFQSALISINVSPSQIRDPNFPAIVQDALARYRLPGTSLELELTESLLIDNGELAESSLRLLKKLGVRIAIDDFGTGYSGLQYLARFPIDTIKIDQGFTRNITSDHLSATICKSILTLGRDLGLTTVAEGVESVEQAELLRSWSCKELQGHLFGKPWPRNMAERAFQKTRPQKSP